MKKILISIVLIIILMGCVSSLDRNGVETRPGEATAEKLFNYGIGRFGNPDWISKYLHVKQKELDKAKRFMAGHGAWMGFFAFLPFLGSAITIVLGLMRSNIIISLTSITIGKILRYIILIFGVALFFG